MATLESINNLKSKEKDICEKYISGLSSNMIASQLQISTSSVKKILKKYNICVRDSSVSHQIYKVNENIFEIIDSHEKAYWIGFLAADGTITGGRLKLALALKDIKHLESFKKFMESTHPILTYKQLQSKNSIVKNKNKDYYYSIIGFSNKKLIQDLSKYSITNCKSFTVKFAQNIPDNYICSYMAGLIDADGFVTVSKNKITIGYMGNENMALGFQKKLLEQINLPNNKIVVHENNKNRNVRFSGSKVFDISRFLYSKTPIYLERKRNKILNFFKKNAF